MVKLIMSVTFVRFRVYFRVLRLGSIATMHVITEASEHCPSHGRYCRETIGARSSVITFSSGCI